jgi:hypothetical protein
MGILTESFGNLSEYLLAEHKKSKKHSAQVDLVLSSLLKPFLPGGIRCGAGTISDVKDRQAGPVDVVATLDTFPPFSNGSASTYMADGVVFALQVRDWAEHDLSQFGELTAHVKKLEHKKKNRIPCLAVSFALLPLPELTQFLIGKSGQSVDGVLCIGHHFILRNSQGLYGNPSKVPFVTQRPGPEALKSFTFFLMHLSQAALRLPFGLADYQHL